MRVLITGGRDFNDRKSLFTALDRLHAKHHFTLLIHGDARGADRLSGEWAEANGVGVLACPADWLRQGRSAGAIRNRQMLDKRPDLVVAFPGGTGTENMVKIARKAGSVIIEAIE